MTGGPTIVIIAWFYSYHSRCYKDVCRRFVTVKGRLIHLFSIKPFSISWFLLLVNSFHWSTIPENHFITIIVIVNNKKPQFYNIFFVTGRYENFPLKVFTDVKLFSHIIRIFFFWSTPYEIFTYSRTLVQLKKQIV